MQSLCTLGGDTEFFAMRCCFEYPAARIIVPQTPYITALLPIHICNIVTLVSHMTLVHMYNKTESLGLNPEHWWTVMTGWEIWEGEKKGSQEKC